MTLQDEAREKLIQEARLNAGRWYPDKTHEEAEQEKWFGVLVDVFIEGATRVLSPETVEMVAKAMQDKMPDRPGGVVDLRDLVKAAITSLGMRTK